MDALTHAIVGVAVGSLSGHTFSVHDPVYIAAVLGSQAPDFDLITRLGGPMSYLRHHRAFSHSLPGVLMWSLLITGGFFIFDPAAPLLNVFLWSLLGCLSHIAMDFFNTHGTAVLWPVSRQRKSCNLLNVFDPVLLFLLLFLYVFQLPPQTLAFASLAVILLYICTRGLLKQRTKIWLNDHFGAEGIRTILIMPCLTRLLYWDFLIKTQDKYYIGRIGMLHSTVYLHTELPKRSVSHLSIEAQKTAIGRFFSTFTPFSYFEETTDDNEATVQIYDLRYYNNSNFVHRGTIVFDDHKVPSRSYIQSYKDKIDVVC